jgi:hypothetical protein
LNGATGLEMTPPVSRAFKLSTNPDGKKARVSPF